MPKPRNNGGSKQQPATKTKEVRGGPQLEEDMTTTESDAGSDYHVSEREEKLELQLRAETAMRVAAEAEARAATTDAKNYQLQMQIKEMENKPKEDDHVSEASAPPTQTRGGSVDQTAGATNVMSAKTLTSAAANIGKANKDSAHAPGATSAVELETDVLNCHHEGQIKEVNELLLRADHPSPIASPMAHALVFGHSTATTMKMKKRAFVFIERFVGLITTHNKDDASFKTAIAKFTQDMKILTSFIVLNTEGDDAQTLLDKVEAESKRPSGSGSMYRGALLK